MAVTCGIYPEYKVDKTVFIAELINYPLNYEAITRQNALEN
jgi:hypothetical protein